MYTEFQHLKGETSLLSALGNLRPNEAKIFTNGLDNYFILALENTGFLLTDVDTNSYFFYDTAEEIIDCFPYLEAEPLAIVEKIVIKAR